MDYCEFEPVQLLEEFMQKIRDRVEENITFNFDREIETKLPIIGVNADSISMPIEEFQVELHNPDLKAMLFLIPSGNHEFYMPLKNKTHMDGAETTYVNYSIIIGEPTNYAIRIGWY